MVFSAGRLKLFKKHLQTLMNEENDYIVYAIWGAKVEGTLTDEQKEINASFIPVMNELLTFLQPDTLTASQKHAIEYLIRSLFIAKFIYMKAYVKNLMIESGNAASAADTKSKSPIDEFLDNLNKDNNDNEGFKRW